MPDGIGPQRLPDPVSAPVVPVNLGQPSAHPAVLPFTGPDWTRLLPTAPTMGGMVSGAELAMRLGQQRREDQGRNALAQLFADQNNLDANGGLKPEALARLSAAGFPDLALSVKSEESSLALKQAQTQGAAQRFLTEETQRLFTDFEPLVAEYDANVKQYGAERARQIGQESYTRLVQQAKTSGLYSPQILQRINPSFDPERLRANILGLKGMQDRERQQNEFDTRTDYGRDKPVEYRLYKNTGQITDITGKGPYTPTGVGEPKGAETKPMMLKLADNTERLGYKSPTGGFVDANTGQKIDQQVIGARNLSTASPADDASLDATAQAIAEYRQAPLTSYAMRSGQRPEIMKRAREINPEYDSKYYAAAQRTLTNFDAGKQGDQVRSLNVAIQHLGVFDDLAKALRNRDMQAVNRVLNYVQTQLGHPEVTNFDTARGIIADEVIKSVVGSGAVFDRESMQNNLRSASSPEQLEGQARTIKSLMAGQLRGLRRQFAAAHLPVDEFNQKLDPETLDALEPGFRRRGAGAAESQGSPAEPRAPIASANPTRTQTMPGDRAEQIRRWNAAPAGTRFVFPDGTEATK